MCRSWFFSACYNSAVEETLRTNNKPHGSRSSGVSWVMGLPIGNPNIMEVPMATDSGSHSERERTAKDRTSSLPVSRSGTTPEANGTCGELQEGLHLSTDRRRQSPTLCERLLSRDGFERACGLIDVSVAFAVAAQQNLLESHVLDLVAAQIKRRLRKHDVVGPSFARQFFVSLSAPLPTTTLRRIELRLTDHIELDIAGRPYMICVQAVFRNAKGEVSSVVQRHLEQDLLERRADELNNWRPRLCRR